MSKNIHERVIETANNIFAAVVNDNVHILKDDESPLTEQQADQMASNVMNASWRLAEKFWRNAPKEILEYFNISVSEIPKQEAEPEDEPDDEPEFEPDDGDDNEFAEDEVKKPIPHKKRVRRRPAKRNNNENK